MDKTQNLTMWLHNKPCGGIEKYNPFDVEEYPVIKFVGPQCVKVIHDEWGIELPIEVEELAKFIKAMWPEELGWKIEEMENAYRFKDLSRFKAVLFYLLARLGGAKKSEALLLVRHFSAWEGECLIESLYDRLRRYYLESRYENLISAYAKIIKDFVNVIPEEKRRGRSRTA